MPVSDIYIFFRIMAVTLNSILDSDIGYATANKNHTSSSGVQFQDVPGTSPNNIKFN